MSSELPDTKVCLDSYSKLISSRPDVALGDRRRQAQDGRDGAEPEPGRVRQLVPRHERHHPPLHASGGQARPQGRGRDDGRHL